MHPKKPKRVFNLVNFISEDGKVMAALQEVETHTRGAEKLYISGLEERKHNGMYVLGEVETTPAVFSGDASTSEELLDEDYEDGKLINYGGILVVDKTVPKRAEAQKHAVPKEAGPEDASLMVEEQSMSEGEVEHLMGTAEEHTENTDAAGSQDANTVDDLSADELNQLDEELEAIMNADFNSFKGNTAADVISAEKASRGDDPSNWTSYANKSETVLDLTRPQNEQKEFVSKTYMIGTTRVVAASEAVKRVLVASLFPEEGALTNEDLEGFEFTDEGGTPKDAHKDEWNDHDKGFGLGLELEEEEQEAKEALNFFDADITSNTTALNRGALDGLRGLACLPTKEEEDRIVYGNEVDPDDLDDGKSAVSRRTRLSRLSSVGGYTNLSKLSNKSTGSSVQMRRGRHMNQKHFASGESMDTELNRMMSVANEKIARMQEESKSQNDQAEPFLTNQQKLALLTEESIQRASLENLLNMEDDVNRGLDKYLGTNMMDNEEIVDGLVDCIMSGQVARAYIQCNWNKLGYGKQKLEEQRKPTIEDDAEALHYIGKADSDSMHMEASKAPVKIVLSKRGIPITSLTGFSHALPVIHEENEKHRRAPDGQEPSSSGNQDDIEQYKAYILPSMRGNETSDERAHRKALTKQLKRERRAQKKALGEAFSNERRAQAAIQFRERSNVQGRRIA